jgi:hypothetical protein
LGFIRFNSDPCIYVKEIRTDIKGVIAIQYQIVALYVDDLILAASIYITSPSVETIGLYSTPITVHISL